MRKTFITATAALVLPLLAATVDFKTQVDESKRIDHALSRLTFGARPGDLDQVKQVGLDRWIERQLHPEKIAANASLDSRLEKLTTLQLSDRDLVSKYPLPRKDGKKDQKRVVPEDPEKRRQFMEWMRSMRDTDMSEMKGEGFQKRIAYAPTDLRREVIEQRAPVALVAQDLAEAKMLRAVYSDRQLEEVLTDFWFNHFNVFLDKGADRWLVTNYEQHVIRPHVLGKFRELLQATAESPAMLFYLDNWQSIDPNVTERFAKRMPKARSRGLNENYARELMELHTLGVDGGYTQKDVQEVARCFTGWTIDNPRQGGGFVFQSRVHDPGEKIVLGVKIRAGGGKDDGLKVLDLLAKHPSTARFIGFKLAQRFVADAPPDALVNAMAKTFQKSDGDLRSVMRTMLSRPEFWSTAAYRSKTKSPLEFVASAMRTVDAQVDNGFLLAQLVGDMGQPLYRKQEPTGYPNSSEEWLNSAGLVARMNFAVQLGQNKYPGIKVESERVKQASLGAPEFQKR